MSLAVEYFGRDNFLKTMIKRGVLDADLLFELEKEAFERMEAGKHRFYFNSQLQRHIIVAASGLVGSEKCVHGRLDMPDGPGVASMFYPLSNLIAVRARAIVDAS